MVDNPYEPPHRTSARAAKGIAIQLGIALILIVAIGVTGATVIAAARKAANRQRSSENLKRSGRALRAYETPPTSIPARVDISN